MQPDYKHPTRGNPHQLTIRQHIHSKHLIKKFINPSTNKVAVVGLNAAIKDCLAKADNAIFCAYRKWDEISEKERCGDIEGKYFGLVDNIVNNNCIEIKNHEYITEYYCLWNVRNLLSKNDQQPMQISLPPGAFLAYNPNQEKQEFLEKKGVVPIHGSGIIDSHFINGFNLQMQIDINMSRMRGVTWGLLISPPGAEFICADSYPNIGFMPISPKYALIENSQLPDCKESLMLTFEGVAELNRISKNSATNFYFARDLSLCPIRKN